MPQPRDDEEDDREVDAEEEDEGDPEDDLEQDRAFMPGAEDAGLDPAEAARAEVRRLIRDPHEGKVATGRRPRPVGPLATFGGDSSEYDRWLVEYEDEDTGRMIRGGYLHPDATPREFLKKVLHLIPDDGSTVTFHLTPLDGRGTRLNGGKPYTTVSYNASSFEVRELKESEPVAFGADALFPGASGFPGLGQRGDSMTPFLMQQQQQQAERETALRAEMADLQRQLMQVQGDSAAERASATAAATADISAAYTRVLETSQKASEASTTASATTFAEMLKVQAAQEAAREARAAEARAAEREDRKEESKLAMKRMELEAEVKREEVRAQTEIRKAELVAQAAKDEAMRAREDAARLEQRREDQNRRDDQQRREDDRRKEDLTQRQAHDQKMAEIAAAARKDEADRAERARQDESNRAAERAKQNEQHFNLMLATIRERNESKEAASPMGAVTQVLDFLGLTPMSALEKGQALVEKLMGGGEAGGLAVEVVRGLTQLGERIIERMPAGGEDGDEEDEDEDEDEDDVPEPEPPPAPAPKPARRSSFGAPPALAVADPIPHPALPPAKPAKVVEPVKTAKEEPATAPSAPTTTALVPAVDPGELRAGKQGVERVMATIADIPPDQWTAALAETVQDGAFLTYVNKVGFLVAFEGEADADTLTTLHTTLRAMGATR